MKVFVKNLKGTQFEIEVEQEHTVSDLKKTIETHKGADVYPAARQMIIHQGKVLKDDTTMKENEVSENSCIVIMLSKKKSSSAPPPTPAAAPPPQPPSSTNNPPSDNALNTACRILETNGDGGRYDTETIVRALRDARNNPHAAVQYLYLGLTDDAPELPPVAGAPPPPPPTGPNATPLDLFPYEPPPPIRGYGNLQFLRNTPQFQAFRSKIRANPPRFQQLLQQFAIKHPELGRLIYENQEELVCMIMEPQEGESVVIQPSTLTDEDCEAIDRLEAMGFDRELVHDVYLISDKNEERAANYLLDHMHEFQDL